MKLNLPNTITIFRTLLAFIVFSLLLNTKQYYLCFALTLLVIAGDYLDGFLARSFNQASVFGAWLDIASDRLIEICYWVIFASLHWISVWIALIFITRGIFVDGIRSFAQSQGLTAFGEKTMMNSAMGKFLVASPFSRVLYAFVKVCAFGFIILAQQIPSINGLAHFFVYFATIFCLIRGIPVLIEGMRFIKE